MVVTRDGTQLFRRDWGTGKPVVFVHGWGTGSEFWQYQMLHLSEHGFRCVAFDRRGHGRSDDPGRGYDYDTQADDLAAVIEALRLRDLTLVGHSMGCGEIVRYLTRHGSKRVTRIVLLGATLPFLLKTPDNPDGIPLSFFDSWRNQLSTDMPKWVGENQAPFWRSTTPAIVEMGPFYSPEVSATTMEWGRSIGWRCSLKARIDSSHALTETDFRDEVRRLTLPTLMVHGTEDRSVPVAFARKTAQLIPNCKLIEFSGAPHGLPLTHVEALNRELLSFLS